MRKLTLTLCLVASIGTSSIFAQAFKLSEDGYFRNQGVDVMGFDDIYPEGHQGGVSLIMHGHHLWQQVEYVMGGGSSHYMFLVLAAQQLLNK